MSLEINLSTLTITSLAYRCRQETERYYRRLQPDERYCFELFRRAIELGSDWAWDCIFKQYTHQVTVWTRRHEAFAIVDEDCDYFVNRAFAKFWQAFSRNPLKLTKFNSLKGLLKYLQLCTYTSVKEYVERSMVPHYVGSFEDEIPIISDGPDLPTRVDSQMKAEDLWQHVLEIVKTEQERIIAEGYFSYDMKPKEIYAWHEDAFVDVVQVRRIKDNFLARLRRDKKLLADYRDLLILKDND